MDEKQYTELAVHMQEVDSRCRSNEHRIDNLEEDMKETKDMQITLVKLANGVENMGNQLMEMREKQDAIYDLTSSVKSIATDMTYIKEDVKEVKSGQAQLNEKVTILENKPANESKKRIDEIKDKLLWLFIGGIAVGLLSTILPNIPW